MFGWDSVSEIGVHCLTLAVQSVDTQYSAGDTLDNWLLGSISIDGWLLGFL